jgi:hypothetical protein
MLHHPQVKTWAEKERRLVERRKNGMTPELQQDTDNHYRRWKNIQRHLQHRQNVTLLV